MGRPKTACEKTQHPGGATLCAPTPSAPSGAGGPGSAAPGRRARVALKLCVPTNARAGTVSKVADRKGRPLEVTSP